MVVANHTDRFIDGKLLLYKKRGFDLIFLGEFDYE